MGHTRPAGGVAISLGSAVGRVALEGKVIHIPDALADPEYSAAGYQRAFGFRTILGVPLLRDGTTIGVFALTRDMVHPFSQQQIDLVTTFADQAGIAGKIEKDVSIAIHELHFGNVDIRIGQPRHQPQNLKIRTQDK